MQFDTLSSKIIKDQFRAGLSNRMDTPGDSMYLVLYRFTILKAPVKFVDEIRERDGYIEFMRVRMLIGSFE